MRVRLTILALTAALLLAPATAMAAAADGGGGLFGAELGLKIWKLVVFISVLLVLRRFAWKPILLVLSERESMIRDALAEAPQRRLEAERLLARQRELVVETSNQAREILAESRDAAERFRNEMEAKAREEREATLAMARAVIRREKEGALDVLRRESVELALAATSEFLRRKLDGDRDRRFAMEYLRGVSSLASGLENTVPEEMGSGG